MVSGRKMLPVWCGGGLREETQHKNCPSKLWGTVQDMAAQEPRILVCKRSHAKLITAPYDEE